MSFDELNGIHKIHKFHSRFSNQAIAQIAFSKCFILLRFGKRYLNFKVSLNYELYRRYNLLFDVTTSSFILSLLCSIFVYWHRKFMTHPRDIFAESISEIQTKVVTLELLTYVLFIFSVFHNWTLPNLELFR